MKLIWLFPSLLGMYHREPRSVAPPFKKQEVVFVAALSLYKNSNWKASFIRLHISSIQTCWWTKYFSLQRPPGLAGAFSQETWQCSLRGIWMVAWSIWQGDIREASGIEFGEK